MNTLQRLRREANLTQRQLAHEAGITPLAVLKNEQGLYTRPSASLVRVLAHATGTPETAIVAGYQNDQVLFRQHAAKQVRASVDLFYFTNQPPVGSLKEFIHLICDGSVQQFCKLLAVHPTVVARYLRKPGTQMPSQLRTAFKDCGVEDWKVDFIDLQHSRN